MSNPIGNKRSAGHFTGGAFPTLIFSSAERGNRRGGGESLPGGAGVSPANSPDRYSDLDQEGRP